MRKRESDPIEAERRALADQRVALADLQQQLAARVAAVQARESELREAINRARSGVVSKPGPGVESQLRSPSPLPPAGSDESAAQLRELAERERVVAAREAELSRETARLAVKRTDPDGDTDENAVNAHQRIAELEQREQDLVNKTAELADREEQLIAELAAAREASTTMALPAAAVVSDADRLANIEARLAELRIAEEAFGRTREELAARSEAVAARERLVGERERELADHEDGWGSVELHELESRLRRLEQQKAAPPPSGFASGMRKLEQQGKRTPRSTP